MISSLQIVFIYSPQVHSVTVTLPRFLGPDTVGYVVVRGVHSEITVPVTIAAPPLTPRYVSCELTIDLSSL